MAKPTPATAPATSTAPASDATPVTTAAADNADAKTEQVLVRFTKAQRETLRDLASKSGAGDLMDYCRGKLLNIAFEGAKVRF